MKLIKRTLDKVEQACNCPDVDEHARILMSPMWSGVPTPERGNPIGFMEYRRYDRTGEIKLGLPVFVESRAARESEPEFIQCPECGWHPVRKHGGEQQ